MAHLTKRFLFSEFGPKRKPLPHGLEFLGGLRFYAITEHRINGRAQRRIEFLPNGLKSLIRVAVPKRLEIQNRKLTDENRLLQTQLQNLDLKYKDLKEQYYKEIKQKQERFQQADPKIKSDSEQSSYSLFWGSQNRRHQKEKHSGFRQGQAGGKLSILQIDQQHTPGSAPDPQGCRS